MIIDTEQISKGWLVICKALAKSYNCDPITVKTAGSLKERLGAALSTIVASQNDLPDANNSTRRSLLKNARFWLVCEDGEELFVLPRSVDFGLMDSEKLITSLEELREGRKDKNTAVTCKLKVKAI